MPQRLRQLENWLERSCQMSDYRIAPASEDASFRRYFRVTLADGSSRIVMDAPPDKEDCRPFVEVAPATSLGILEIIEKYKDENRFGLELVHKEP